MPDFAGFVYTAAGAGNSGLTVNLYARNGTSSAVATTTTNSDGAWTISHGTEGRFDVEIVVDASNKFRIKYDDQIQCELGEFGQLYLRGTNDAFTTKLASTPTASRTITFPDATATALLGGYANTNSGVMSLTSTANSAAAVYLHANGGTSETVKIYSNQGTSVTEGAESINILSDDGGVGIRSTANLAKAVNITSDGGTTGSIAIFNDQGTSVTEGAESISILSDAGGIGIRSTADLANAVNVTVDGGTSSTMTLFNDQGTAATEGAASIQLLSDLGGINIKSGLNAADAILLTADGGTSEKIRIHADQGTGVDSIELISDAGGIELNVASGVGITGTAIKNETDLGGGSASAVHLATQSSIKTYVDAQIATEDTIAELNDTNISSPAAGHLLVYDNTASVWDNAALSGGTGLTATLGDGTLALAIDSTVATLTGSQTLTNKSITAPTITGTVGGTQTSATITALTISSMAGNWTNASRTVADMGIVTTIDINGGTIDGTVIGGTTTAAGSFDAVSGTTGAFSSNVTVGGNLTVSGTTTTVDTTNTVVKDSLIELNNGVASGSNSNDSGLLIERGSTGNNAIFMWDESATGFTVGTTTSTAASTGNLANFTAAPFTAAAIVGTTIDASTDFTIGDTVITDGVVTDSTGLQLAANMDINGTVDISSTLTLGTVAAAGTDTDKFLVLDGSGNVDYRTGTQVLSDIGGTGATALDDVSTGDAAATLATTVGNITIDAQATDADVVIKVDDNGTPVTAVTFDGSDEGNAIFVNDIQLNSDGALLEFGADQDTVLTHTDGTGLTLNSTNKLTFGDVASYIQQSTDGTLRIDGEAIIDLNASTRVDVSGDLKVGTSVQTATIDYTDGDLAMTIADGGGVTFAQSATLADDATITLQDEGQIIFADDDPSTEDTGVGIVMKLTALTGLAIGELVHIDANGKIDQAHADNTLHVPAIGISLEANSSGSDADVKVLLKGVYKDSDQFNFTPGQAVYVDHGTEGNFQQTPSTTDGHFIQRVGIALTADSIYFAPSFDVIERD